MMWIELNVTDERAFPGRKLILDHPEYADEFANYLVKIMKKEYKKAIDTQRYSYKWKPLSVSYLEYKKQHNLSLKTWEATGLLYKSIIYRKVNGGYIIGIDPHKRYNSGVKVLDVAKTMEYGNSKNPARPLFRPIFSYMRKNIGRYWNRFLKEKGVIK